MPKFPKKSKGEDNNFKIEGFLGNMAKDSKKKENLGKSEDKKLNKNIMEKLNKKEEKNSKNKKEKVKLTNEEKFEENKNKLKQKKVSLSKEKEIIKEIEKEEKVEKKSNKKKKLVKKKIISDSDSSYNISKDDEINFSDYKMEIEEELEKEDNNKNKKANKSKSNSKNKKKSSIKEEETFDNIDFQKLKYTMDEEEEIERQEKNNKNKIKDTPLKKTNKKSNNIKSTSYKKKQKRDASPSNNSNIIEGPLSSETIVITGEFDLKRDEITNILKSLGARVTGSVSSRTTILLHGDALEDGRPVTEGRKYRLAQEKNIKIMDINDFEKYVQNKIKNPNWSMSNNNNNNNDKEIDIDIDDEEESKGDNINIKNQYQKNSELWTTKYHPKKISDLIGNKSTINKLITWLDDWNSVVLEGKRKKVETKFHRGQRPTFENINARAALITGDPGIGKTSSVRLIAKLKGYKTYETNASDQRNKTSINKNAGFIFDNKTLFGGELQDKNLIIMDEVDGMSGNEDRGGISAIIDIIKKTKIPIICIANDRQSPKLKSLANYCYDLKFVHPDKRAISIRLGEICKKEGINYEINALEYLCEICGNDIRQIINFVELWTRKNKSIKFKDLAGNNNQKLQGKDEIVMLKNFDAARELLNSKSHNKSFKYLLDLYFIDYDLIPLLIQENYLSTFQSSNAYGDLENISLSSDLISCSDVIDKKIRTQMDWRLLSDRGLLGCCTICKLNKGFVPFPKFPEALGKISSLNKIKREIIELKECFHSKSSEEIRRDVLPVIYNSLVDLMVDGDIEGVFEIMRNYHITMDFFKENMTDLVEDKLKMKFDKIGTVNKSNLTKAYNKNFKSSVVRNKNKKGKIKSSINSQNIYDENGNPLNEEIIEEENEENDESSESIISIKNKNNKNKTKEKSRNRSKSNDNGKKKRSKSKSKIKDKSHNKGKKKTMKKKKDEEEEEEYDFEDDED